MQPKRFQLFQPIGGVGASTLDEAATVIAKWPERGVGVLESVTKRVQLPAPAGATNNIVPEVSAFTTPAQPETV